MAEEPRDPAAAAREERVSVELAETLPMSGSGELPFPEQSAAQGSQVTSWRPPRPAWPRVLMLSLVVAALGLAAGFGLRRVAGSGGTPTTHGWEFEVTSAALDDSRERLAVEIRLERPAARRANAPSPCGWLALRQGDARRTPRFCQPTGAHRWLIVFVIPAGSDARGLLEASPPEAGTLTAELP